MPAIPTHARIEIHLSDEELVAFQMLIGYAMLTHSSADLSHSFLTYAAAHYEPDDLRAETNNMHRACMTVWQATDRALKERMA